MASLHNSSSGEARISAGGRLPGQLELGQASFRTGGVQLFAELANCGQLAIWLHVQDGL
jgi:hypothetical protein